MTAGELHSWLIEPIDPLVFGDGRTIGTVGVARSRVLPPPSQLAGAVRSQAGSDADGRWKQDEQGLAERVGVVGSQRADVPGHDEASAVVPRRSGQPARRNRRRPMARRPGA